MTIQDLFSWGKKQLNVPFVAFFGQRAMGMFASPQSRKYLEEYRNWVFACVQARGEEVGNIQLRLFNGDEEITNDGTNDLMDLLSRVNPASTKMDLFMGTQAYLDLEGNSFWFLARDKNGKGTVREIYLLRPDKMMIIPDKDNPLMVEGYVYIQPDGKRIPFEKREILHIKNFNPMADLPFPHRGMGIVQASAWAIDTDNEARRWNYAFFQNSARPDGFLTKETPGAIPAEEYRRIKEMWEQEHQGSSKAHRVAILSGGLKWQDLTRSQKDMDFIEQRRFSRDEILALFRTPKTIVGIVEDVNRSNAEASNFIFALRTITPLMQRIVDYLNEFLVPEFGEDLYLDFVSPVPADRVQTVNEYAAGIDKWYTRNEIRLLEGLPPTKDGDKIFGTFASIPIDETTEPTAKQVKKPRAKRMKKSALSEVIKDAIAKLPEAVEDETPTPRQLSELAITNYKEVWKRIIDVETKPLAKDLSALLTKQEKETLANIREEMKGLEVGEFKFKAIGDLLFNPKENIAATISLITPFLRRYIEQAGDQAILLTGIDVAFDHDNPITRSFIEKRAEFFAENFTDTTIEKLREQIEQGLEADETIEQISERVSQFYDTERTYRSDRAARTEVAASSNFAAEEAYSQAGVEKKQWLVVAPEDEDCLSLSGDVVDIGEPFQTDAGEDIDNPPVHPNCVCTVLPVFK